MLSGHRADRSADRRCHQMSRAVKAARPDLPVVWGGWHPSMFARECLAEPAWMSWCAVRVRPPSRRSCSVLRTESRWTAAPGARCGCADGTMQENPARPLLPVEMFRAHDYGLIPVERYFELKGKRQLDFISSQGCNFRCAFCSDPFVYERKWVGLGSGPHGAAAAGAVGTLSFR